MARKFVRNITGTNLGGNKLKHSEGKIEPFDTNVQNDILNDEEDIFIRQEKSEKVDDGYICLTDNIKNITSGNDVTEVEHKDKNEMHIETKETIITSKNDLLKVDKLSTNNYELEVDKANKDEAEKGTTNSKAMTPLQTKNAIEYNNVNVIPDLVKEHETPTEIISNSEHLTVEEKGKNRFELDLELPEENGGITEDEIINIIEENEKPTFIESISKSIVVDNLSSNGNSFSIDSTNILDGKSTQYRGGEGNTSIFLNDIGLLDYINVRPDENVETIEIYKGTPDNTTKQFKIVISNSFKDVLVVEFSEQVFENMTHRSTFSIDFNTNLVLTIFKFGGVYYLENVIGGRSETV